MKNVHGIWLPDAEEHLLSFATGPGWTYQSAKFLACAPFLKGFSLGLDVGAHVGLWAMMMREVFTKVIAFEPMPLHIECFKANLPGMELHECALGETDGAISMRLVEGASGRSSVADDGEIKRKRLDSFDLEPDFIKIDCEGYEYFVLRGAEYTITKHKPVIIVEQKPGLAQKYGLKETQAVTWLQSRGYKLRNKISGDFILSCD